MVVEVEGEEEDCWVDDCSVVVEDCALEAAWVVAEALAVVEDGDWADGCAASVVIGGISEGVC